MSGKILIVDREPQMVRRAQAAAKKAGMTAVVASTTAYALELLGSERPDIALFDLTARDGSWVTLIRQLRELDPEVVVIATAVAPTMELVMEAMRHRVADVLEKPLAEKDLEASIRRIQERRRAVPPSSAIDIVLVDDDPMTLSFASRQLSQRNIIARTVSTLADARREIAARRPEVVILDIVLAGENGLDLLPALSAVEPPIPAILITSSTEADVALEGLRAGAFAAFPKPVDWNQMYRSIVSARRWLATRIPIEQGVELPATTPRKRATKSFKVPPPAPVEPPRPPEPPPQPVRPPEPPPEPPRPPAPFRKHCHYHFDHTKPVEIQEVKHEPPPPPPPEPVPVPLPLPEPEPERPSSFHPHCKTHFETTRPIPEPPPPPPPPPPPAPEPEPERPAIFKPVCHEHYELMRPAPEPPPPPPPPPPAPAPEPEPELPPAFKPSCKAHFEHTRPAPEPPPEPELPPRFKPSCQIFYQDSRPAPEPPRPPVPAAPPPPALAEVSTGSGTLQRAALALTSLPSGILILDARPAVVELNPAAEELLSLPRDAALDGGRDELPHLGGFFTAAQSVLDNGNGLFFQEAQLHLPRGPRTMGFGAVPLRKGQREGVLIFFQDITSRRAAAMQRRQTERLASLGLIAAGLTAELSDPIAMSTTYAEMIQKENASVERCHHHASRLKAALNRTSQLASYVTTLLHRPPTEPGPVNLHEVVSGVTASLQRRMLLGNHPAELDLAASAPVVMGESIDFEHLLLTLLMSANESVRMGGAVIVKTINHTGVFELTIESKEPTVDTTDPGQRPVGPPDAGPAMEISRSLVKRYGGAIRMVSPSPFVRHFTVRMLPAKGDELAGWAIMGVSAPSLVTSHPPGLAPVGMLITDDDIAEQVRVWLQEAQLRVDRYSSTDEALMNIKNGPPTVVLLQGPPQDGQWLRFLRSASELHNTALVSLLGKSVSPRIAADLDELSGHRSLRWPVDKVRLLQSVALAELEGLDLQNPLK